MQTETLKTFRFRFYLHFHPSQQ
uniref:Uncharacterized protein n=1 Tax=Arundo donax TaxID=35708 RepID=A0A0A9BRP4_ARUDO